jgi:retinol dehydrogenase 12
VAARLEGRTIVVTGGNAGIGLETVRGLAAMGATVVMASRNLDVAHAAAREISSRVEVMRVDLASLADVRRFARELRAAHPKLDVLVNNAGLHTAKRALTVDGYEETFAVNHLAHFLLTRELLPSLRGGRVVTVASEAHRGARLDLDDPMLERKWSGMRAYANSKLCNILFAFELAKRAPEVSSFVVHPGSVRTGWARGKESGIFRLGVALASPFLLSPEKGARTSIYAASSPDLAGKTGLYLVRSKPATPTAAARDPERQRRLWEISERLASTSSQPSPDAKTGL